MIDFSKICARHGIHLQAAPEKLRDIQGIYVKHQDTEMILYNDELPERTKLNTLAHELGHATLDHFGGAVRDSSKVYGSDMWREIEANLFAIVMVAVAEVLEGIK